MVATRRSNKEKEISSKAKEVAPEPQQLKETQVLTTHRSPLRSPLTAKELSSFPLPDDDDDDQADADNRRKAPAMQATATPSIKKQRSSHSLSPSLLVKISLFLIALTALAFISLAPILPPSMPPFCSSIILPHINRISPSLKPDATKACGTIESHLSAVYVDALHGAKILGARLDAISSKIKTANTKIVLPFITSKDGSYITLDAALVYLKDRAYSPLLSIMVLQSQPLPTSATWLGANVLGAVAGPSYDAHAWEATASESFAKQKPLVVLLSCSINSSCAFDLAQQIFDLAKKIETPLGQPAEGDKASCIRLLDGKIVGSNTAKAGPELQETLAIFHHQCPATPSSSPLVILSDLDKIQSLKALQVLNNLLSESGGLTVNSAAVRPTGSIFVLTISTSGAKIKDSDPKAILSARLLSQLKPKPFIPSPDVSEAEIEEGQKDHERQKEAAKAIINGLRRRIDLTNL